MRFRSILAGLGMVCLTSVTLAATNSFVQQGEIAAWSRIADDQAVIVAVNTHGMDSRGADVTIDANLHPPGSKLHVLYRSDWSNERLDRSDSEETIDVMHHEDGRATFRVDLPPAGMAIFR